MAKEDKDARIILQTAQKQNGARRSSTLWLAIALIIIMLLLVYVLSHFMSNGEPAQPTNVEVSPTPALSE